MSISPRFMPYARGFPLHPNELIEVRVPRARAGLLTTTFLGKSIPSRVRTQICTGHSPPSPAATDISLVYRVL